MSAEKHLYMKKEAEKTRSLIEITDQLAVGGDQVVVMAGPCAVESEDQLMTTARGVARAGARVLRGGAFKPRTSPYSFQGLKKEGLELLRKARAETGLPIITEVLSETDVEVVAGTADILQIGARNMQNFALLHEVGRQNRPVMLKRGWAATIEEWLSAAEYILAEGNENVILCERGIRTHDSEVRNTLDLNAVVAARRMSHLPVIVDPSHGTGKRKYVAPMARAAIASGADGLLIEVHNNPQTALCDGAQSLHIEEFDQLMRDIDPLCQVMGRSL